MGTWNEWNKGTRGEYHHIENAYNGASTAQIDELRSRLESGDYHVSAVAEALLPSDHPLRRAAPKIVANWHGDDEACMWPVNAELSGPEVAAVLRSVSLDVLGKIGAEEPDTRKKVEFMARCGTPQLQVAVEDDPTGVVKVWVATPYNSGYMADGANEEEFDAAVAVAVEGVERGATGTELNNLLGNVAYSAPSLLPVFTGPLQRSRGPSDREVTTSEHSAGEPFPGGYGPTGPTGDYTVFTVDSHLVELGDGIGQSL